MAANGTEFSLNSSQSSTCSFLGNYSWREEYLTPTNFILVIAAVSAKAVMIPFTVLLNALVIFLVWRKPYLRKQKPCVLLACLAGTDLLVGAVVLPLAITGHAFRLSRAPICVLDAVALGSICITCGASLWHLVVISGERYVAIKHALRYETLVTTRRLTAAVGAAWAIPVTTSLSGLINIVLTNDDTIFYGIILVAIPAALVMIGFCQVAVFLESRRHLQHILAHQVSEAAAKEILKKDKAARTTTLVVGALLLSYAPAILYNSVTLTVRFSVEAEFGGFFVMEIFVFANSLISPMIYCIRTQDFQRALRELLGLEAPRVNEQAADIPLRVVRRRISPEAQPRSSSGGERQIAPSELAPVRRFRSQSLDLSRELTNERRSRRKNSI